MLRSQADRATLLPASDLSRLATLGLLAVVILFLDLTLLSGTACGVLYMAVILGTGWLSLPHHTMSAAVLCTGFTLLSLSYSPVEGMWWPDVFNRPVAIAAIWVTAILMRTRGPAETATDPDRVASQLRRSEAQYRSLVDGSLQGIVIADEAGICRFANQAVSKICGCVGPEDLVGRKMSQFIAPCEQGRVKGYRESRLYGRPAPVNYELEGRKLDGTPVWVEVRVSLVDWGEGQNRLFTIFDITERKRAEEALRESEQRFRDLIEGSIQGILIHRNFELLFANQALADIHGYDSPEEVLKVEVLQLVPPHERARIRSYNSARMQGIIVPAYYEHQRVKCDGTLIWCGIMVRLVQWDGAPATQVTIVDITERKRAEQALQLAHDSLEHRIRERTAELQKLNSQLNDMLAEKEVLLRELHHRVKNNLQVIISLLQLQSRSVEEPQVREVFKESQNRIRAMALVHQTLYQSPDLSRINAEPYIKSLSTHLFQAYRVHAVNMLPAITVADVTLELDVAISCGLILNELISNALKYAFTDRLEGLIAIDLHMASEQMCLLRVLDTGVGLPDDLDIENPTTFGLRIVRLLVKQLRGTITFEQQVGTEVTVTLPVSMGV